MKTSIIFMFLVVCVVLFSQNNVKKMDENKVEKVVKSEAEWRKQLTPLQYHVTRESGTERAFSGEYDHFFKDGYYECVCCGNKLFNSTHKYNSGCGWPAFSNVADLKNIKSLRDTTHGMVRTEVRCVRCDAHLGHVFPDGPTPIGLRYCINSASIKFVEK
jgi:peptide-methionine (R)-S-oxide reductase